MTVLLGYPNHIILWFPRSKLLEGHCKCKYTHTYTHTPNRLPSAEQNRVDSKSTACKLKTDSHKAQHLFIHIIMFFTSSRTDEVVASVSPWQHGNLPGLGSNRKLSTYQRMVSTSKGFSSQLSHHIPESPAESLLRGTSCNVYLHSIDIWCCR